MIDPDKLEELFEARYKQLKAKFTKDELDDFWVDYCDKHKIFMLHADWLRDELNRGLKGRICIHNCEEMFHENVCPWLLVPKKFAERCLVLGGLP